jgi:hypothetical protein
MSINLNVHFDEQQLQRVARQIDVTIHRGIQEGVKRAVDIGTATAKTGGFQDRTGQLRATIYGRLEGWTGDWCWGLIHSPQKYTSFVEFPTKAHEIWPKAGYNAKKSSLKPGQTRRGRGKGPHEYVVGRGIALRWVDGSGEHFARMVHHHGTTGFFFMRYAELVARREIEKSIQASIRPIQ